MAPRLRCSSLRVGTPSIAATARNANGRRAKAGGRGSRRAGRRTNAGEESLRGNGLRADVGRLAVGAGQVVEVHTSDGHSAPLRGERNGRVRVTRLAVDRCNPGRRRDAAGLRGDPRRRNRLDLARLFPLTSAPSVVQISWRLGGSNVHVSHRVSPLGRTLEELARFDSPVSSAPVEPTRTARTIPRPLAAGGAPGR